MQASDVVWEYLGAQDKSFKESTIQKAWLKSGISVNENGQPKCTLEIFTANDFAPSVSLSTQLNLLEGYPIDQTNPSSSEAGSDNGGLTDSYHSNSHPLTTCCSKHILVHEHEAELKPLPPLNSYPLLDSKNDGDIISTTRVLCTTLNSTGQSHRTHSKGSICPGLYRAIRYFIQSCTELHRALGILNNIIQSIDYPRQYSTECWIGQTRILQNAHRITTDSVQ